MSTASALSGVARCGRRPASMPPYPDARGRAARDRLIFLDFGKSLKCDSLASTVSLELVVMIDVIKGTLSSLSHRKTDLSVP